MTILGLGFLFLRFRALNPNIRMTKDECSCFRHQFATIHSSITCLGQNSNIIIIRVWQI
jgi:hypothetical protein